MIMRKTRLLAFVMAPFALALTLTLGACDQSEGEPVARAQIGETPGDPADPDAAPTIETTIASEVESACRSVIFEDTSLTHCVAVPGKHSIATALAGSNGANLRGFAALSQGRNADTVAFAFNAGMFDAEGDPIGYFVQKSERLKTLNRADGPGNFHLKPNGVFFGSGETWEIRTTSDFLANVTERPQFGTQSGPMLVIDGELHPEFQADGPSRLVRNAVGIDSDGHAHFVISNAALSFGRLARFYRDELKVRNALFLDGNVSSLWNPATGRMDKAAPIGPMVVVSKRGEN
jgi:uncharacterized protein YigE (DUF2233 family)